jgi:cytochrome c
MKSIVLIVVSSALLITFTNAAIAEDSGEVLFKKHNCTMCHAPSSKILGPSLEDISRKYVDNEQTVSKLEQTVRNGGNGSFGEMPMPADS